MSRIAKIWIKLTKKPTPSDISWREAENILRTAGYSDVKSRGSHFNFRNPETGKRVTLKRKEQIDKGSVDDIVKAILELAAEEDPIIWLEKRGK